MLVWMFVLILSSSAVPGGGQTISVQVGPFTSRQECAEVERYVDQYVPNSQTTPCVAILGQGTGSGGRQ